MADLMQQNATANKPFVWSKEANQAVELVAEDRLTDDEIAAQVGRERTTIFRWKKHPEFASRVEAIIAENRAAIRSRGIANLENRVDALNDRWKRMRQVIEERAQDPEVADVPGGTTGLIVKQLKGIGKGSGFRIVEEFAVDTSLLSELRAHEQQAAKELGQWTERAHVSGSFDFSTLSDEELEAIRSGKRPG